MRLDPQDLKEIVDSVGQLIDARAQTTETNLTASIRTRIKASETKLRQEIKAAKEELREELTSEMQKIKQELKADIHSLRTGVAKKLIEHEGRLDKIEKTRKSPLKN